MNALDLDLRVITYLAAPICTLTTCGGRLDELDEDLSDVLDVHPRVDIRPAAMVERRPRLDARPVQRRVINTIGAPGTRAPAVYDGRAHHRGPQFRRALPGPLDEQLCVAVDHVLRYGPEGADVALVRPHLWVQLAEVVPLGDDARAAEVDVGGREGGRGAGGRACEEGAYYGLVVRVAVVWEGWLVSCLDPFSPPPRAFCAVLSQTYGLRCLPLTRRL